MDKNELKIKQQFLKNKQTKYTIKKIRINKNYSNF